MIYQAQHKFYPANCKKTQKLAGAKEYVMRKKAVQNSNLLDRFIYHIYAWVYYWNSNDSLFQAAS
jgi:hypothetical protein